MQIALLAKISLTDGSIQSLFIVYCAKYSIFCYFTKTSYRHDVDGEILLTKSLTKCLNKVINTLQ
jgi:hypothetical protein